MDGLSPDIMHDMLEGTVQLTLRCLLRHLIDERLFNLRKLNERISGFHYGDSDSKNKPSEIANYSLQESDTLKQSGLSYILDIIIM